MPLALSGETASH